MIALHGLLWPDEIRDPAAVAPPPVQPDEDEIDEAVALIDAMTPDNLTGPKFTDGYTEALHAVIEAKQEDRRPPQAPEPTSRPGQLVDLMATLQESVSKARTARGETLGTDTAEAPTTASKKAHSPKTSSRAAGRAGGRRGTPAR